MKKGKGRGAGKEGDIKKKRRADFKKGQVYAFREDVDFFREDEMAESTPNLISFPMGTSSTPFERIIFFLIY